MKIPIYQPTLGVAERRALLRCFDSGWISHRGPEVKRFEEEFAETVGAKYAVAVSSGTAALHCALVAAGVKPGDEVIVPALTYIATANAVVHAGARPVFADVDAETWCLSAQSVWEAAGDADRVTAAVPVHLYGYPAGTSYFALPVIEDCAEALGTKRRSGADVAAWSFFANKTITTGEGGMVTTNSEEIADSARRLSHQGLVPGTEYQHDRVAHNYRMTALQAAIGRAQLKRLPSIVRRKREIAAQYREGLKSLPVKLQADHPGHSWWLVSITQEYGPTTLRTFLKDHGVETRGVFPPITSQPAYAAYSHGPTPVADLIALKGMSLPSWPGLTDKQVKYVCDCIKEFYE